MHAGQLKAFSNLSNFYSDLRTYRRDADGKVVKERDHATDAMRYLIISGRGLRATKPKPSDDDEFRPTPYCPGADSSRG